MLSLVATLSVVAQVTMLTAQLKKSLCFTCIANTCPELSRLAYKKRKKAKILFKNMCKISRTGIDIYMYAD